MSWLNFMFLFLTKLCNIGNEIDRARLTRKEKNDLIVK